MYNKICCNKNHGREKRMHFRSSYATVKTLFSAKLLFSLPTLSKTVPIGRHSTFVDFVASTDREKSRHQRGAATADIQLIIIFIVPPSQRHQNITTLQRHSTLSILTKVVCMSLTCFQYSFSINNLLRSFTRLFRPFVLPFLTTVTQYLPQVSSQDIIILTSLLQLYDLPGSARDVSLNRIAGFDLYHPQPGELGILLFPDSRSHRLVGVPV